MSEYMPYIVSIIGSVIACLTSIIVCIIQLNRSKKETAERIKAEKEAIQLECDSKIRLLQEEYALKTGSQIMTDFVSKTVDSVYESPAVKNSINKQAQNALLQKNKRNRKKR